MKISKFRPIAFLPLTLASMVLGFLLVISFIAIQEAELDAVLIYSGLCCFLLLILAWLVLGEIRTKAVVIELDSDQFTVRNFYGFGSKQRCTYKEFDGFTTAIIPSRTTNYEFLYLMKGNMKIVKLSEYYHKNYATLKQEVASKIDFIGDQPFRMSEEIKEIIR